MAAPDVLPKVVDCEATHDGSSGEKARQTHAEKAHGGVCLRPFALRIGEWDPRGNSRSQGFQFLRVRVRLRKPCGDQHRVVACRSAPPPPPPPPWSAPPVPSSAVSLPTVLAPSPWRLPLLRQCRLVSVLVVSAFSSSRKDCLNQHQAERDGLLPPLVGVRPFEGHKATKTTSRSAPHREEIRFVQNLTVKYLRGRACGAWQG